MAFAIALAFSTSQAAELVSLDETSIHYKRFVPNGRNPYFLTMPPKEELNFQINFSALKVCYVNTKLHAMTNSAQYHLVGLNAVIGARITKGIHVQYEHFSKHLLDTTYPYQKFGVEDSIGVKFFLYQNTNKRGAFLE